MKTFRAELYYGIQLVDYMEFETDSFEKAEVYAEKRFGNAFPMYRDRIIVVNELK